ncbi:hypothetical protein DPMN_191015 [Dreissena polymorpha]|uniref:Uncharacterized protein n=1 Tax=Dreissena polymorpha TaxID=45954 RepID=A0A9D3Y1D2_DREPO|nr:hypothetical protein DPMN_191015 [Dreissena polymorpha]
MIIWGDWKAGMRILLMLNDNTPPQQYLLQFCRQDTPEPETSMYENAFVRKDSGQILVSAKRWKQDIEYRYKHVGEATKNGPSDSFLANWDIVQAFPVCNPLPEIQHWI